MQRSEDVSELVKALVAAQAALQNPVFDKTNPHFKSQYASLAQVRDTVVPVLAAQGLVITQLLSSNDIGVLCETTLWHTSGQFLSESFWVPAQLTAQAFGSAAHYARRYSLMALCNVTGDEDDDGEGAPKPAQTKTGVASGKLRPKQDHTEDRLRETVVAGIQAIFQAQGVSAARQEAWWQRRVESFGDPIPLADLQALLKNLSTAQTKQGRSREGVAWTTLRAHEHNATLSQKLRDEITMLLTAPGVTEARALEMAGVVHDWVSKSEEGEQNA